MNTRDNQGYSGMFRDNAPRGYHRNFGMAAAPRDDDWGRIEDAIAGRERSARLDNQTAGILAMLVLAGVGICGLIYAVFA